MMTIGMTTMSGELNWQFDEEVWIVMRRSRFFLWEIDPMKKRFESRT